MELTKILYRHGILWCTEDPVNDKEWYYWGMTNSAQKFKIMPGDKVKHPVGAWKIIAQSLEMDLKGIPYIDFELKPRHGIMEGWNIKKYDDHDIKESVDYVLDMFVRDHQLGKILQKHQYLELVKKSLSYNDFPLTIEVEDEVIDYVYENKSNGYPTYKPVEYKKSVNGIKRKFLKLKA